MLIRISNVYIFHPCYCKENITVDLDIGLRMREKNTKPRYRTKVAVRGLKGLHVRLRKALLFLILVAVK